MKILLAGATGFIGKSLIDELLRDRHELYLLTRHSSKVNPRTGLSILQWDGKTQGAWAQTASGVDAVINLSGAGIAEKRWTPARKKVLESSRIDSTRALVTFMHNSPKRPSVFLNASAVGYYGNVPDGNVPENAPHGKDFLSDLCKQWEDEAKKAVSLGIRTVLLRTGIVLEQGGGALAKMVFPFQIFAGGPLGSGKQWLPWIHREDEVGAILFALKNQNISGPVNLTAPHPVTMEEFCTSLGKVLHRPSWAPVPSFALHLLLGEMADMLLGGQKAVPQKLSTAGYSFKFPELEPALKAILQK